MTRRLLLPLAAALALSACATTGSVRLSADQGFAVSQQAFKSLQQSALFAVQSGLLKGSTKASVIDAIDKGTAAETIGFNAEQAGNSKTLAAAALQLANSVTALQALGVGVK